MLSYYNQIKQTNKKTIPTISTISPFLSVDYTVVAPNNNTMNYTFEIPVGNKVKSLSQCPYGIFTAFYPSSIKNCTIYNGIDTTNMILTAAKEYDIKVHLGLAFPLQIEYNLSTFFFSFQHFLL